MTKRGALLEVFGANCPLVKQGVSRITQAHSDLQNYHAPNASVSKFGVKSCKNEFELNAQGHCGVGEIFSEIDETIAWYLKSNEIVERLNCAITKIPAVENLFENYLAVRPNYLLNELSRKFAHVRQELFPAQNCRN